MAGEGTRTIVVMLVGFFLAVSLSLGAPAGSFGHWKGESWRAHEEASKALKTLRYLKVRQ